MNTVKGLLKVLQTTSELYPEYTSVRLCVRFPEGLPAQNKLGDYEVPAGGLYFMVGNAAETIA